MKDVRLRCGSSAGRKPSASVGPHCQRHFKVATQSRIAWLLTRGLWVTVFAMAGLMGQEGFAQKVEAPNVVLIVSDDQRHDTIAALGNRSIRTPSLDRLVQRGSVFLNAICANPICTPSRGEILTGCSGLRNRVFDFGGALEPTLATLPEPFAAKGYTTWYCGKWHNDGRPAKHGYAQTRGLFTGGGGEWASPQVDYRGQHATGYQGWIFRTDSDTPLPQLGVGLTPNISQVIADAAIDVIQTSTQPFLLHVNFTAPHDPLLLPEGKAYEYSSDQIPLPANFVAAHPFDHGNLEGRDEQVLPPPRTEQAVRADLAAYYSVITHLDEQVGRIIDALDQQSLTERTIIVFCSDHGLAMGSHGLRGKQNQYEHTIRVPLILAGPGIPSGQQLSGQAYLRDLFPTLCELAGLEIPDVDGRSQEPVLKGEKDRIYEFTVGYFRDSQRMIRTDRWKLIRYPLINQMQLFDLQADPLEKTNLADQPRYRQLRDHLSKQLDDWLAEQRLKTTAVSTS